MAQSTSPVLIIGAGVSGLTLAQGLHCKSIPFQIFERNPKSHASQGHRFRIQQSTSQALLNILPPQHKDLFARTAVENNRFHPRYPDARVFKFGPPIPVDDETGLSTPTETRRSTPLDRKWIRQLLSLGVEAHVSYEKEFVSYKILDEGVEVSFADGTKAHGKLLIGADGIKSRVRHQLQPSRKLLHLNRWIMWGRTLLTPTLRSQLSDDHLTWYMAQDKEANVQVVMEPMIWPKSVHQASDGALQDFEDYIYFAFSTAPDHDLPRTAQERKSFLQNFSQDWHPILRLIFEHASHDMCACVPLLSSKPDIELPAGGREAGRVTLLGDAAHAMSPMGGSGADTAVLNAIDLAETVSQQEVSKTSIQDFEKRMAERAKVKIEHSFRGGQKFGKGKEWWEYHEIEV